MNSFMTDRINSYLPDDQEISDCEKKYGLQIHNKFAPHGEVGGDLWGIRPLGNNEIAIYLFDFLGHGESAGKEAAFLYSIMEDMFKPGLDPGAFLTELNKRFYNSPGFSRYATIFLGLYNKESKSFDYSSAAHQPFYHVSLNQKEPNNITNPSLILGAKEDAQYQSSNISIQNNEILLTYSDALPEARRHDNGELFDEKLQETIYHEHNEMRSQGILSSNIMFESIIKQYDKYCMSETNDDLTFLVFQVR